MKKEKSENLTVTNCNCNQEETFLVLKSRFTMKYDISEPVSPKIPVLGKGTECVKLLLSQVSKDMYEPMIPMFFPILGAHVSGTEFQYPDLSWKETCGMMANLVADSGGNKG